MGTISSIGDRVREEQPPVRLLFTARALHPAAIGRLAPQRAGWEKLHLAVALLEDRLDDPAATLPDIA
jgi:hypothetical protein